MSKKIIAFGASSSKKSINKKLASFVASQVANVEVKILDLNDFEMPIYSIDKENESGIHPLAQEFKKLILSADGIIISFAEHNGAYSAAYKNIYDWASRIDSDVWQETPMLLLATSPGGRGGIGVLEMAFNAYSRGNKNISGKFSLPSFQINFSEDQGILNEDKSIELNTLIRKFETLIS